MLPIKTTATASTATKPTTAAAKKSVASKKRFAQLDLDDFTRLASGFRFVLFFTAPLFLPAAAAGFEPDDAGLDDDDDDFGGVVEWNS
jgi:hypothetical protein